MSRSEFDAFVKQQQFEKQEEEALDPKQQLREWHHYLDCLYEKISRFMEKYTKNNAAIIEYHNLTLNEDFVGEYEIRKMLLKIGRSTITFTPIGTMLIGSKGRVDVQGPCGDARLILINKIITDARYLIMTSVLRPSAPQPLAPALTQIEWEWKIITPPPGIRLIELTDEAFFEMILSVANA